ncbi:MAG: CARDB domain-containing protein, partial [Candidatus Thermoplasmatota archaeon]|nr:CARDB domain-containing protein [Candidatus Thermoplasmatota archaeon]MEC8709119.1 CARDB domain-containing protein [Candidatus Thermoplasmatota archaeon]
MTKARVATLLVLLMLLPVLPAGARSVHSTSDVDLLPQGVFDDANAWDLDDSVSFSTAPAQHTQAMVADDHLTFMHERPENLVAQTVWATSTPTDSNASLGAPDGAYTWSTGPDIDVNGFDVSGLTNYAVRDVTLLLAIEVPGALYQDKVRISHETGGVFDLVKTWSNTGGGIDYMDGQPYRIGLDDPTNWTWNELADLTVRLDYVSEGTTDDSELRVDAVGLEIVVLTPWYGGEQATATTTTTAVEVPVLHLDLAAGTTDGLSLASCGLQATSEGTTGQWTSALVERPAEQRLGRVAYAFEGPTDNLSFEMRTVAADGSVGAWTSYDTGTLLPDVDAVHLRVSMNEGCMTRLTVDINDPTLTLIGRIHGDVEGLLESSSRWAAYVNGVVVANEPVTTLGSFQFDLPVGHAMAEAEDNVEVRLGSVFTWDADGSASSIAVEFTEVRLSGGYSIEYDEDPVCQNVGDQHLTEDAGGIVLPLITRCTDDRTPSDDLAVTFANAAPDVANVELTEGQVVVSLVPEASGNAVITTTVMDVAGNTWTETWTIHVANVDDAPVVGEFPGTVPVEHEVETTVSIDVSDVDSTDLQATTNRSWATVDLAAGVVRLTAPTPGYVSVGVTVCDDTSCTDRTLDLDVRALADLSIDDLAVPSAELESGSIVDVVVYVRNSGAVTATLVDVRLTADGELIGTGEIPLIEPGGLGVVEFAWKVPEDGDALIRLEAEVDRSATTDERDESNNLDSLVVTVVEQEGTTDDGQSAGLELSGLTVVGTTVFVLIAIVGLFAAFAPKRIRKIE